MSAANGLQIVEDIAAKFAPHGTVRAAINLGNRALAQRTETNDLEGISVRIARELARYLDLQVEFVRYESAGRVFQGADKDEWDVAFLATDPERRTKVAFSSPYLKLEGTYLVRDSERFFSTAQLDAEGVTIGVTENAAYDLFLTRSLRNARLVRTVSPAASFDLLKSGVVDAIAGVRQTLIACLEKAPETALLADSFSIIEQAVCVPAGRPIASAFIEVAVNRLRSTGFFDDAEGVG